MKSPGLAGAKTGLSSIHNSSHEDRASLYDQLLAALKEGGKVGFALFFCGGAVIVGKYYSVWPATSIDDSWLPSFSTAFLLGGGLLIANAFVWTANAVRARTLQTAMRRWFNRRFPSRQLNTLTRLETESLVWLLIQNFDSVEENRLDEPFCRLVRKGILLPTDPKEFHQVLRINPRILRRRDELLKLKEGLPKHVRDDRTPPWRQRIRV